jgi:beta-lactamase regulating signal transducer with metallopeptidase domain
MSAFSDFALDAARLAINSAITGSLVALSAALAFRLAPTLHPRIRYAIAVGAFFAAAIFPVFATFQIFERNQLPTIIVRNSEIESTEKSRIESAGDFAAEPPSNQNPINQNPSPAAASFPDKISAARPVITINPAFSNVFLLSWAIVAFLFLIREIFGHLSFAGRRRKWRLADEDARGRLRIPDDVRLYLSDGESPLAIGVFRTAIVLPARLCDELGIEAARQIARHESNHLRWRDPSVNAVLRIIRALFWINPALWYLERAARLEREAAADFAVAGSCNFDAEKIAGYANALLTMAKRSAASPAGQRQFKFVVTEIGRGSGLEKRVSRLFQATTRASFFRRMLAVFAVCAGFSGTYFLPLASSSANSPRNAFIVAAEPGDADFSPNAAGENIAPEILRLDDSSTLPANHISEAFARTLRNLVGGQKPEQAKQAENKAENVHPSENAGEAAQANLLPGNAPVAPVNTGEPASVAPTPPGIEAAPRVEQIAPQNFEAPQDFLRDGMASVGYPNLSEAEIAALRKAGASHFTVRELASVGYPNLPLETLIRLRENTVGAAYIREMKSLGYDNLSPETLIDFRLHGVSAAYIREMAALGYGNLPAKTLVAFRRNAVTASYIDEMRAAVKGGISAGEIVDMRWLGVSRRFINELDALGYKNLTANQLINMRQHGVTTAFIEKMRSRGGGRNYSADDLISIRMNGEK